LHGAKVGNRYAQNRVNPKYGMRFNWNIGSSAAHPAVSGKDGLATLPREAFTSPMGQAL
jgi:hypothetical protein